MIAVVASTLVLLSLAWQETVEASTVEAPIPELVTRAEVIAQVRTVASPDVPLRDPGLGERN